MDLNFLGGNGGGRSGAVDAQSTMNFYPEYRNPTNKSQVILIGTPGLEYLTKAANGKSRGFIVTGSDRLFAVIGNDFLEVNADYTVTYIGKLKTLTGMVSMAENVDVISSTTQIMVSDGIYGYIYKQLGGTFTQITDSDYLNGSHCVWFNGYFVQNVAGENKFIYSTLYDGTTWNAADMYVLEGNPDDCTALGVINNELWAFGKKSLEVWITTGDSDDPFQRVGNGYINIGAKAIRSIVAVNNSIIWLGSNREGDNIVWQASNYIPQRISTHAEEYAISQLSDIDDCVVYAYQQEGHMFYVMNFVSSNKTLVYDMSTGLWHSRSYFNSTTGQHGAHRGICSALWGGKIVVGDRGNANIYKYNLDKYTDNGNVIVRYRQGPTIHEDRKRLFFSNFELDVEKGVGLVETGTLA